MKAAVNTVTFRALAPEEIVPLVKEESIDTIEWAGDVHVPPNDPDRAKAVKALCEREQIHTVSYGSYYPCDLGGGGNGPFRFNAGAEATLETAKALGAKAIRVWGGRQGSGAASPEYREEVARCLQDFCDKAAADGMTVHLEFHKNTLTDTAGSALALLETVARKNLYSYWQPRHGESVESNLADIARLAKYLSHVHIFHWLLQEDGKIDRRPLKEGTSRWQAYLAALIRLPGERYGMIEFVCGDELSQFREDAGLLRSLLAEAFPGGE